MSRHGRARRTQPAPLLLDEERCYCWSLTLPHMHTLAAHREGLCGTRAPRLRAERRCELPTGHRPPHITMDACGRPEYVWRTAPPEQKGGTVES